MNQEFIIIIRYRLQRNFDMRPLKSCTSENKNNALNHFSFLLKCFIVIHWKPNDIGFLSKETNSNFDTQNQSSFSFQFFINVWQIFKPYIFIWLDIIELEKMETINIAKDDLWPRRLVHEISLKHLPWARRQCRQLHSQCFSK